MRLRSRTIISPIAYLFLGPALLLVAVVIVYPLATELIGSFYGTKVGGFGKAFNLTLFVGLNNFRGLVNDPVFWRSLLNNFIIFLSVPLRVLLGLMITQILHKWLMGNRVLNKLSRLYRVVIFIPFVAPIASIGIIFVYLLNATGPINAWLNAIGLGVITTGWLTNNGTTMWAIMLVVLWTRVGFAVLLFSARLLSVDQQIFRAASVDGAPWRTIFWRIGLPELRHTIEFVSLLGFLEAFSWSFAYVYVLGQGAFKTSTWIVEIYIYNNAFRSVALGGAYAAGVVLFVLASGVAAYQVWSARNSL